MSAQADRPVSKLAPMGAGAVSLFTRSPHNPILTADMLPYDANTMFNPAAVEIDGETVLLVRVEDRRGISHLQVARSADGVTDWEFPPTPAFPPDAHTYPEEVWGIEDPRATWLAERGEWVIAYTAFSRRGPLVSLATTKDFRQFERLGPAQHPDDKDAALFPRRFEGRWMLIHRPTSTQGRSHIWASFSPDLRHWGDLTLLLEAREGAWWDADKIGLGPPPLETPDGWLIMYHGVHRTAAGSLYRVGLALLDLDEPTIVLRRSDDWVFGPSEPYERIGDVVGVVFPSGWIHDRSSQQLRLYYGAADTSVCLATADLGQVLDYLSRCPRPERRRSSDLP
jgi:predicted GH43/DUF377 family glycosyl hydrolase